jgi:hypothetical protein
MRGGTRVKEPRSSKVRLGRSTLIASVLVATMGSSVAMALQSDRGSKTIGPGGFGTVAAKCDGGRTAVSGGFAAPGFDPATGPTVGRIGSKRVGKRQIQTRAFNFSNQAGKLFSFAYCAQHDHGLEVRSATTRVEPNTRGSAVARCPRGTSAVGGGFGTYRFSVDEGPQVITLTSKRRSERRWKVVGVNINNQMRSGTLIAYAYCAAPPFELITRSKEVTPPVGATQTFNVRCPNGSGAYSGGFDGHVQVGGSQPQATAAITSKRASGGRVWRTSALSVFGNPAPVTAYAYCRKR